MDELELNGLKKRKPSGEGTDVCKDVQYYYYDLEELQGKSELVVMEKEENEKRVYEKEKKKRQSIVLENQPKDRGKKKGDIVTSAFKELFNWFDCVFGSFMGAEPEKKKDAGKTI